MVLDFFKRFFGTADHHLMMPEAVSALDLGLDLQAAIAAHENWKLRLEAVVDKRSYEVLLPEVVCFDDRCELGRWIHGIGRARLGAYPGFTALREHHRMFHCAAANVVSLAQAGRHEQAKRMLATTYERQSQAVLRALAQLQHMLWTQGALQHA